LDSAFWNTWIFKKINFLKNRIQITGILLEKKINLTLYLSLFRKIKFVNIWIFENIFWKLFIRAKLEFWRGCKKHRRRREKINFKTFSLLPFFKIFFLRDFFLNIFICSNNCDHATRCFVHCSVIVSLPISWIYVTFHFY
jgi:hypothetical protein